jgi:hypothetical protein
MVLRSYALMVHNWDNGIKQAIARKCRDARRSLAINDDETDHELEVEQDQAERRRIDRLARAFIDDEAHEVIEDTDDDLPNLNTPPITPTQTQNEPPPQPYYRR